MSPKRKDKEFHRVTVYLTDEAYRGVNNYIAANYASPTAYGAWSSSINNAVTSCYCNSSVSDTVPTIIKTKGVTDDHV